MDRLLPHVSALRARGLTALYLYGSTAREEALAASDVDFFADVDYSRFGFVEYMDTRQFLKQVLETKIDFTTRAALHPALRDRIIRSAVNVFDDATLSSTAAE